MQNTILSEKDSQLIEKAILQHGRILGMQELLVIFKKEYAVGSAYKRISLLSKVGWLRRIKKGLYLIVDSLTARFQIDVSLFSIANALVKESYVSFSQALNYYQMFDQHMRTIASVTDKENKRYIVGDYTFVFSRVKKDMYFGFSEKRENGKAVRIADAEKALIDYLYLDKSFGSASLVFGMMRDHYQGLDLKKLQEYALRSNITIQRKIGFMLDTLTLDSALLHNAIKHNRGTSRFTRDSPRFNAKWRLYYDDRIIK